MHQPTWNLAIGISLWAAFAAPALAAVDFNREVRPILSDKCFACHGPDAKNADSDLRLDLRELAIEGADEGEAAIVPGKPEASELVRRIYSEDADERMPPADSHKELSAAEKELLKKWIAEGAEYKQHWSLSRPVRPAPPALKPGTSAGHNPIDAFILARLQAEGLAYSPEADRATLVRRVSYDLTGLPPTLAEIDAFVNDASPKAYEAMVDRYLAKPAFGERMALAWMDAARYGDSSVFHVDGPRQMWGWRDWVIRSYNENMPFDRFTIEQLAGDLLPGEDPWPKVASAFNRNHGTTDEGGVIPEEARVEYVVDRVKTTANVWLGLSMECAQCHDHKYDPISQREYYAFFAFFNQTTDPGMQSRHGNQPPLANVPNSVADLQIASLTEQRGAIERRIADRGAAIRPEFEKWVAEESTRAVAGKAPQAANDPILYLPLDETAGAAAADRAKPERVGKVEGTPGWTAGQLGGGFTTSAASYIAFDRETADFNRDDHFSYGCWVKPNATMNGVPLSKMDNANGYRGWDLYVLNGRVSVHLIQNWPTDAIKVTTQQPFKPNDWTHLFVTYDGSGKAAGVKIYVNGVAQQVRIEADQLSGEILSQAPLLVGRRHANAGFEGVVDEVRIYDRTLSEVEVQALAGVDPLQPIFATPAAKRTPEQQQRLLQHYLANEDSEYSPLKRQLADIDQQIAQLKGQVVTVMVMQEMPKPRETFLLMRGNYASPDKDAGAIQPDVPAALGTLPEGAPHNRLGLAQWLVRPEHPLTARVAMNRYWSLFFGRGLVGTVMDFGAQGEFPTHPELLDWLAADFVEHGWDRKRAIKQILLSAAYRQSSNLSPQLAEVDPGNHLLARGPRFRLQGEFIRDAALAVSGLLVDRVGGPSTKPYQPLGLWEEVGFGDQKFAVDKGEGLYRKSMYIYWKRSAPHPGMMLLDVPSREKCTVDRSRTNTPLQALYTMNDTQFVEAARVLAERIMVEGGSTPPDRLAFAHRIATGRLPSERVAAALLGLYQSELEHFRTDPPRAEKLLAHGDRPRNKQLDPAELAAWTMVATTILNMDAALTRN